MRRVRMTGAGPFDGQVIDLPWGRGAVSVSDGRFAYVYELDEDSGDLVYVWQLPVEAFDFAAFEREFREYTGEISVPTQINVPATTSIPWRQEPEGPKGGASCPK
jgi:hypothetical protein